LTFGNPWTIINRTSTFCTSHELNKSIFEGVYWKLSFFFLLFEFLSWETFSSDGSSSTYPSNSFHGWRVILFIFFLIQFLFRVILIVTCSIIFLHYHIKCLLMFMYLMKSTQIKTKKTWRCLRLCVYVV